MTQERTRTDAGAQGGLCTCRKPGSTFSRDVTAACPESGRSGHTAGCHWVAARVRGAQNLLLGAEAQKPWTRWGVQAGLRAHGGGGVGVQGAAEIAPLTECSLARTPCPASPVTADTSSWGRGRDAPRPAGVLDSRPALRVFRRIKLGRTGALHSPQSHGPSEPPRATQSAGSTCIPEPPHSARCPSGLSPPFPSVLCQDGSWAKPAAQV